MNDFIASVFSSDGFMPHGHCYLWQPGVLWLNLLSDSLITLAYYSIPVTLVYFVQKQKTWFSIGCSFVSRCSFWLAAQPT